MRKLILFVWVIGSLSAAGQQPVVYYQPYTSAFAARKLSRQEVAGDLRQWQEWMEQIHPRLYHSITADSLTRFRESLISAMPDSLSHQQALLAVGRMIGAINEGHIILPRSDVTDSLYIGAYERLPFSLFSFTEDGMIVDADWSREQRLPRGSRVLSINGYPASRLHAMFLPYFGGFPHWKNQLLATFLRKLLFLHDIHPPFHIRAITPQGDSLSFTTDGLTRGNLDSLNKAISRSGATAAAPFTIEIGSDSIALIRFNSMNQQYADSFRSFLRRAFTRIRDAKCRGLVVDLRQNSGGSSSVGDLLTSYITDRPYRLAGGSKWKVSEPYKAFLRLSNSKNEDYLGREVGTLISYRDKNLQHPPVNELRFQGKVALLIGPSTFSSANMLADGIKTFQLARVFGTATGESGNDFGEIFPLMLPATRVIVTATSKMFVRASGDENDFSPTLPDVEVKPELGRDAPLEAARKWILE